MSPPRFLRLLLLLLALVPLSLCVPRVPRGTLINCGSAVKTVIEGREWLPDADFVSGGTPRNLTGPVLFPTLSTVRSFPNNRNRKSCYTVNVYRDAKYMVRTTYFYHGGGDTESPPPVFDQIVDGTLWAVVNTTEDYARGDASYYEGVFLAKGKTMSVCLGSNSYTESDPFISALEFVILEDSLYNSTDFNNFGLGLVARHGFGYTGHIIRYPDDKFDRFWEPFGGPNPVIVRNTNASVSGLWNQPPLKVFETELTTGQAETMELDWPPGSVPESRYYIALYFALGMEGSRVLNISINGVPYYKDLDVTPEGLVVFASRWPLSGATRITLTPSPGSSGGPLINAGEVFAVLPLGGTTLTRDVIALQRVKQSLHNPPSDWNGDPCMPSQYSWTGITCSSGPRIRVVTLNLTSMGLSGSLSPSIANMTGLSAIYLGNNNLSGPIPDLSALKRLENLHLEDNNFSGDLPPSLGNIDSLHELFLQNNNLTGQIPTSLIGRSGLDLRTSGNSFSSAPPSS